jgi:hypothetical protein
MTSCRRTNAFIPEMGREMQTALGSQRTYADDECTWEVGHQSQNRHASTQKNLSKRLSFALARLPSVPRVAGEEPDSPAVVCDGSESNGPPVPSSVGRSRTCTIVIANLAIEGIVQIVARARTEFWRGTGEKPVRTRPRMQTKRRDLNRRPEVSDWV